MIYPASPFVSVSSSLLPDFSSSGSVYRFAPLPPFLASRKLTHRERILYAEMLETHALGLPRTPRQWWTLNHLIEQRPRYFDAPYEIPHQRRRLQVA